MDSVYESYNEGAEPPPLAQTQSQNPYEQHNHAPLPPKDLALWRWANVTNLDLFLQDVYQYYIDKGFFCTLLRRGLFLATIMFVVVLCTYLSSCIDYKRLRGARTLADVRIQHCLAKTSLFHKLVLWLFISLWLLKAFHYVSDLQRLLQLKQFYEHLLNVDDNEIQTISWQQVVARIVALEDSNMAAAGRVQKSTRGRKLDPHAVANRIMRKENYMIALFTKNVLNVKVEMPIIGEYKFLTKTLEYSISICVIDFVFNQNGQLRPIFLDEGNRQALAESLARRFRFAAIMNIVLAPFAIVYMSAYYFFKYFSDYHKDPSTMGSRQYTPLAEWELRELNELFHLFKRRLSMSVAPALRYISQFPREKTEIALRFLIFVASSFAAVLGFLTIYDPELLAMELATDKTVLFYIGIFGTMIAVFRGMITSEAEIFDPESSMRQIIEFTHYLPENWEKELHSERVKVEFCRKYDLKLKIILRDLASVFINPIILWYNLSISSPRIVDFFREFTVHVDDLGYVCSYAVFNFDHANKVKARAEALDKYYATEGKMLKSYLSFVDAYGPPTMRGVSGNRDTRRNLEQSSFSPGEESVMGRFDKFRTLPPLSASSNDDTFSERPEIDLLPPESPEDLPRKDAGLFGILNSISKVDRRAPL